MTGTRASDRVAEAGAQDQADEHAEPREAIRNASSQTPRVLVLASTFPKSGRDSTPAFVLQLCRQLTARFGVTVLAPAVSGAGDRDEIDGVSVRRFHYFWPRSLERLADGAILENLRRSRWQLALAPLLLLFELLAAYRLARRLRPSVIHAHWFIPQGLVAVIVGRMLRVPVVVTSHGGDLYGLRGPLWRTLRRAIASRCAALTVVSGNMANIAPELKSGDGERPRVISMGVDADLFNPSRRDDDLRRGLSPDGPLVLFVGRLAEKKGVQYLLQAMPSVLARHPEATLAIAGDGPLRGELEALARRLGIADRVKFLGGVAHDELPRYYASADVFVGPSVIARGGDTEGLPVALLEAMATGRPVVATSVGGAPEAISSGTNGLLVEPGSPDALAAATMSFLDDPAAAERMARAARQTVDQRFAWPRIGAAYADLLSEAATPALGVRAAVADGRSGPREAS